MNTGSSDPFIEKIRSITRDISELQDFKEEGLRSAAVLFPFVKIENEWQVLFIHRAEAGEFHRGEVAFPGGAREAVDHSLADTAIRETKEELGIAPAAISVLGFLPPSGTISRYWVTPIIGMVDWPVTTQINPAEVKHYFTIPFVWLADSLHWKEHEIDVPGRGRVLTIDYLNYQGEHLWGITAKITNNLLSRLTK